MELGTKAEREEKLMKGWVLQVKPDEIQVDEICLFFPVIHVSVKN